MHARLAAQWPSSILPFDRFLAFTVTSAETLVALSIDLNGTLASSAAGVHMRPLAYIQEARTLVTLGDNERRRLTSVLSRVLMRPLGYSQEKSMPYPIGSAHSVGVQKSRLVRTLLKPTYTSPGPAGARCIACTLLRAPSFTSSRPRYRPCSLLAMLRVRAAPAVRGSQSPRRVAASV